MELKHEACTYCADTGIAGWDDKPQFCGECAHGKSAIKGWNARAGQLIKVQCEYQEQITALETEILRLEGELDIAAWDWKDSRRD